MSESGHPRDPKNPHAAAKETGHRPATLASLASSALVTAGFFLFVLLVLRPGYWVNDDVSIIWNILGYPGPRVLTPFLIFSNSLLGLLLVPLYALPGTINWEIVLFCMVNAGAVWAFLFLVAASGLRRAQKLTASLLILAAVSILVLNITFTITAALAGLAGFGLLALASRKESERWGWTAGCGVALILAAGLIRIQMLGLDLVLASPGVLLLGRHHDWRRSFMMAAVAGLLVAGSYAFDRLYVRNDPGWSTYYTYNATSTQLQDTHRLQNIADQGKRVGWTANDVILFRYFFFFDDPAVYSPAHIRYVVDRTSATSQYPRRILRDFLDESRSAPVAPYYVCMLGIALWVAATRRRRELVGTLLMLGAAPALNLVLYWAYKDPDYVLAGTFGGSIAFTVALLAITAEAGVDPAPRADDGRRVGAIVSLALAAVLLGPALLGSRLISASRDNVLKQSTYATIVRDLESLQARGEIRADALIYSPSYGLPLEWASPFTTSLPRVPYFDTGWSAYSPTYFRVLKEWGIASLPKALYEKDNVYLMAPGTLPEYLGRYYEEHQGVRVRFTPLYAAPNLDQPPYAGIRYLYKVTLAP